MVKLLKEQFPEPEYNVISEKLQKSKGRSDIEIEYGKERILLEIKTRHSARACIRRAVGQLLEYGYYGNTIKPKSLIIVSDEKPKEKDLNYLKVLNKTFGTNFYYQLCNQNKEKWELNKNDLKKLRPLI